MRSEDTEDPSTEYETSLPLTWPKLFTPERRVHTKEITAKQEEKARRLRQSRMRWLRRLAGASSTRRISPMATSKNRAWSASFLLSIGLPATLSILLNFFEFVPRC